MRAGRSLSVLMLAVAFANVACHETAPPEVGLAVRWLSGPGVPDDVHSIRLLVARSDSEPEESIFTVAGLEEAEGRRFLVRRRLPTGEPFSVRVEGLLEDDLVAYVGWVGPIILEEGERRYVTLQMYALGKSTALTTDVLSPRLAPTATTLLDGRVLVAGGFTAAPAGDCPGDAPTDALCFRLTATADAYLFDPASGLFHPTQGPMTSPRGGHSATLLPDGEVLIAGGASHATLVLARDASTDSLSLVFQPEDAAGDIAAHDSFELFAPSATPDAMAAARNDDPGRGSFDTGGTLQSQRFGHGAQLASGGLVLLAGGVGAGMPDTTFEVYDHSRAAATEGLGILPSSHPAPALVRAQGGSIWIFGAPAAVDNDELASLWTPGDGIGSAGPATDAGFPNGGTVNDRPELAWAAPAACTSADGSQAVVAGWAGPRCRSGPTFEVDLTEPCGPPAGSAPSRSVVINLGTGDANELALAAPLEGSTCVLLADGAILFTGGLSAPSLGTDADALAVSLDADGQGTVYTIGLEQGRILHATAALANGGALAVGGVSSPPGLTELTLLAAPEVVLPQP